MTKHDRMFALLEEHQQSRLTIAAFCIAKGMGVKTFYYWRRKFRASRPAPAAFIPIAPPAVTPATPIRLSYPNGVSIHLPAADVALIAQLIRLA